MNVRAGLFCEHTYLARALAGTALTVPAGVVTRHGGVDFRCPFGKVNFHEIAVRQSGQVCRSAHADGQIGLKINGCRQGIIRR